MKPAFVSGPRWIDQEGITAESFEALAEIALKDLENLEGEVEIVCGPISTGGRGTALENFRVFSSAISALLKLEHALFNQMPYETGLGQLQEKWRAERPGTDEYCMPILEVFYGTLFATKRIARAWFLPGWESSFGASWEHEHMKANGVEIVYLENEWIDEVLAGNVREPEL